MVIILHTSNDVQLLIWSSSGPRHLVRVVELVRTQTTIYDVENTWSSETSHRYRVIDPGFQEHQNYSRTWSVRSKETVPC